MKKGFTLVELLAVIVILAIILVIAVPKITDVIESTKKSSMDASFKLIINRGEKEYENRLMLGTLDQNNDKIECLDFTNLSNDYSKCSITFNDGIASLTLVGTGKFEGITCYGTKDNYNCKKIDLNAIGVNFLKKTLNKEGGMYQDDTIDHNYRYKGANPNNYVSFNNELWRIIGIFNVSKSLSEDSSEKIKIVREMFMNKSEVLKMSWDSNSSFGTNDWENADIKTMLNTYYIGNSDTCIYCSAKSQSICKNNCNDIISKINSNALEMIDDTMWNLGAMRYNTLPKDSYVAERENAVYSGRPTSVIAKVGLPYASDYAYANGDRNKNCTYYYLSTCKIDNWLGSDIIYWTLTPDIDRSNYAYFVSSVGTLDNMDACTGEGIRPTVYLKSDIRITSGTGTSEDPYILSI